MLKQGVKTINAEFIWTRALSQLSFAQSRPVFCPVLSLKLMSRDKKTLVMSLNLTPLNLTSTDARIKGLVSNVDYL